jgi:hypothetical protein
VVFLGFLGGALGNAYLTVKDKHNQNYKDYKDNQNEIVG